MTGWLGKLASADPQRLDAFNLTGASINICSEPVEAQFKLRGNTTSSTSSAAGAGQPASHVLCFAMLVWSWQAENAHIAGQPTRMCLANTLHKSFKLSIGMPHSVPPLTIDVCCRRCCFRCRSSRRYRWCRRPCRPRPAHSRAQFRLLQRAGRIEPVAHRRVCADFAVGLWHDAACAIHHRGHAHDCNLAATVRITYRRSRPTAANVAQDSKDITHARLGARGRDVPRDGHRDVQPYQGRWQPCPVLARPSLPSRMMFAQNARNQAKCVGARAQEGARASHPYHGRGSGRCARPGGPGQHGYELCWRSSVLSFGT